MRPGMTALPPRSRRRVAAPASRDTSSFVPTATMRLPRTPTAWATVNRSSTVMIFPLKSSTSSGAGWPRSHEASATSMLAATRRTWRPVIGATSTRERERVHGAGFVHRLVGRIGGRPAVLAWRADHEHASAAIDAHRAAELVEGFGVASLDVGLLPPRRTRPREQVDGAGVDGGVIVPAIDAFRAAVLDRRADDGHVAVAAQREPFAERVVGACVRRLEEGLL